MQVYDSLVLPQGMPRLEGGGTVLRRHGDEVERLPGGYYIALGRCDDTMNLGGIKARTLYCVIHTPSGFRSHHKGCTENSNDLTKTQEHALLDASMHHAGRYAVGALEAIMIGQVA